jgi:Flp pilus assembly protein TadG
VSGSADRRTERGAALVEMAVVSSLLMVILLGIITFGLTHHQNIAIGGAAREAARFGATYPVDDAGSLEEWLRDVAQVAENATSGSIKGGDTGRLVCVAQGSGSDATAFSRVHVVGSDSIGSAPEEVGWCFENTAPANDVVVQVRLQREGWIEGIVISLTPTLTGEATNRFERVET